MELMDATEEEETPVAIVSGLDRDPTITDVIVVSMWLAVSCSGETEVEPTTGAEVVPVSTEPSEVVALSVD